MIPPAPTRIVDVPPATCPISTAVAARAMPGRLWCSASQEAAIAECLAVAREVERVWRRSGPSAAGGDRGEVEDRERKH